MSNLARKLQDSRQQHSTAVMNKPKNRTRRISLSPGEKILGIVFLLIVCAFSVKMVSNYSAIYQVNKEIQQNELAIQEQKKVIGDLEVQVSELSTYERIWEKAKELGLVLNENNVKVVQGE